MRVAVAMAAMAVAAPDAVAQDEAPAGRALTGIYDGGQNEIAAGLELRADGRFRYGLSYGALDEEAAGRWTQADNAVLLTSDPVVPPRFVLQEQRAGAGGALAVRVELPAGMSGQYFVAAVDRADGTATRLQLTEEGEMPALSPGARPTAVTLYLPVFDLGSAAVPLSPGGGDQLRFRFEPHDLGKVAFAGTALRIEGDALVLLRHDRAIRFRRVGPADARR